MTDRERFLAFLHGAGFTEDAEFDNCGGPGSDHMRYGVRDDGTIVLSNEGNAGYCSFYSTWKFDAAGKLESIGHWE